MSEVIWVAAISSASGLIGAAIGSLVNVWGPASLERRRLEHERVVAASAERQAAASAWVDSLPNIVLAANVPQLLSAEAVRLKFVATLGPGEGQADRFTREVSELIRRTRPTADPSIIIQTAGSLLFAWMRGDITVDALSTLRLQLDIDASRSD